jgi:hypothetical protein
MTNNPHGYQIVMNRTKTSGVLIIFEYVLFPARFILLLFITICSTRIGGKDMYWCPTQFQYQIMFPSYYRKAKNVTSRKDISYFLPPGSPEFTPCSLILRFPVIRGEHYLILKLCRTPVQVNQ